MISLSQFLKKIGANSYEELNPEEQKTYKEWEAVLNGRQITSSEVRQFLDAELDDATAKLIRQKLGEREDIFLKMKVDFIRRLTGFLDGPDREKKQIEQLINNV